MSDTHFRIESDSMGDIEVPAHALYGAQTQRAVDNFPLSGICLPRAFIRALGLVKGACAAANAELGLLEPKLATAIKQAAASVSQGQYDNHFPVDVFQTGSGTSSNMNANEVIASLASAQLHYRVHPNDQVNLSQSSNDVIPSCIHLSAARLLNDRLLLGLDHLARVLENRIGELTELESIDNGKSSVVAQHVDITVAIDFLRYMAGWATKIESCSVPASVSYMPDAVLHGYTRREPVGVVGAIIAWNFPLLLAVWKLGPALATGCTFVIKPAQAIGHRQRDGRRNYRALYRSQNRADVGLTSMHCRRGFAKLYA